MNLSPGTVFFIIAIIALANILVLLAVSARSRAARARQLVEVDALLAPPARDDSSWENGPENRDPWLPASDGWPTARHSWSDASDGWPVSGALGAAGARRAEPADPQVEPFEFPAPTPLEQRYQQQTEPGDEAEEAQDDEDDDDMYADDMNNDDMNDTDMAVIDDDASEDGAEMVDEEGDEGDDPEADEPRAPQAEEPQEDEPQAPQAVTPIPIGGSASGPHGRDALTGLMDATAFEEAMSHEEAREQRYGHPATVIVFELDGLAKLVDRLGSDPGDRIETALADTIMRLARRADYVARLERGRYAALLPVTDEVAAINYVERIRRACDLWLESGAIAMRLAIGWASTAGDAGLSGAVRVATERMRVELRRNSRQVGDMAPGAEAEGGDGDDATEDAVGL